MIFFNRLRSICLIGFLLVINGWTQDSLWEIPHPGNTLHPGSESAPHSDPRTYPFETEFQDRVDSLVADLAAYPIWNYRKGYYQDGNDPAKRVPAHAAARLMLDPNDPDALAIMNDDRAPTEHYHFAAVNWARFLPIFGSTITDETFTEYSQRAATYDAYTSPGGTENHKVMWFTSGLVLPHYIKGNRIGDLTKDAATEKLKTMLRSYVKGLFSAGQGEWDSSTYLVFDLNGMMNIYDFHPDPECRLMAKAALDWFVAGYALKYTDGVFCSPHKRGYADEPADTKTDESGWIWWGTESDWFPDDMGYHYATFHTFTSSYRPNKILCDIATGNMPDFEAQNTKPDYWFGLGKSPTANQFQETVYKTPHYTMGTLWQGHYTDISRFQLVAEGPHGGLDFAAGSPLCWNVWSNKWQVEYTSDGSGYYDQSCQVGAAHITMTRVPDESDLHTKHQYTFFDLPLDTSSVTDPVAYQKWLVVEADSTFIGIYPLVTDSTKIEYNKIYSRRQKEYTERRLYFHGARSGFILQLAHRQQFDSVKAFAEALQQCKVKESEYWEHQRVEYTSMSGRVIDMQYNPRADFALVTVDEKAVDLDSWKLYESPYINCENSIMTVSNGNQGYVIDFRGDLPVYSDLQTVDVNHETHPVTNFRLYANYPNPFNAGTTIRFSVDEPAWVNLTLYNIQGQNVRTLIERKISNGDHRIRWEGKLENGQPAPTGVYFVRLYINGMIKQNKILFLK